MISLVAKHTQWTPIPVKSACPIKTAKPKQFETTLDTRLKTALL